MIIEGLRTMDYQSMSTVDTFSIYNSSELAPDAPTPPPSACDIIRPDRWFNCTGACAWCFPPGNDLSTMIGQHWLLSNYIAFNHTGYMLEKYYGQTRNNGMERWKDTGSGSDRRDDSSPACCHVVPPLAHRCPPLFSLSIYLSLFVLAPELGGEGAGGEYVNQKGFGWTNGVALDLLVDYGRDPDFTLDAMLKRTYLLPEMVRREADRERHASQCKVRGEMRDAGRLAPSGPWLSSHSSFLPSAALPWFCLSVSLLLPSSVQAAFVDVSPMLPPHAPLTDEDDDESDA